MRTTRLSTELRSYKLNQTKSIDCSRVLIRPRRCRRRIDCFNSWARRSLGARLRTKSQSNPSETARQTDRLSFRHALMNSKTQSRRRKTRWVSDKESLIGLRMEVIAVLRSRRGQMAGPLGRTHREAQLPLRVVQVAGAVAAVGYSRQMIDSSMQNGRWRRRKMWMVSWILTLRLQPLSQVQASACRIKLSRRWGASMTGLMRLKISLYRLRSNYRHRTRS